MAGTLKDNLSSKPSSYSLQWNTFQTHLGQGIRKFLEDEELTDVTLATADGHFIKSHRLILSLCSPFFRNLFKANPGHGSSASTVVILSNIGFQDLNSIIQFIYYGEVNVQHTDLDQFLKAAEVLQIEGLAPASSPSQRVIGECDNASTPSPVSSAMTSAVNSNYKKAKSAKSGRTASRLHSILTRNYLPKEDNGLVSDVDSIFIPNDTVDWNADEEDYLSVNAERLDLKEEIEEDSKESWKDTDYEPQATHTELKKPEILVAKSLANEYANLEPRISSRIRKISVKRKKVGSRSGTIRRTEVKSFKSSSSKLRPCPYCSETLYRSNISRHICQSHHDILIQQGKEIFSCEHCGYVYRTRIALDSHLRNHHHSTF